MGGGIGLRGERGKRVVTKYTLTKFDRKTYILLLKYLLVSVVSGFSKRVRGGGTEA